MVIWAHGVTPAKAEIPLKSISERAWKQTGSTRIACDADKKFWKWGKRIIFLLEIVKRKHWRKHTFVLRHQMFLRQNFHPRGHLIQVVPFVPVKRSESPSLKEQSSQLSRRIFFFFLCFKKNQFFLLNFEKQVFKNAFIISALKTNRTTK